LANWWASDTPFLYQLFCTDNKVSLLDANYSGVGWDGIHEYYPSYSANPYSCGTGYLNYYYIQDYEENKPESVGGHEIGHILGLGHVGGAVLMNAYTCGSNSRYCTYGVYTPQSDDEEGVNYLYD
jgi:hypothetical protein